MKPILLIIVAILSVYAVTLQGEFTFDDYDSIHYYTTAADSSYTWDSFWHGHHLGRCHRRLLPNAILTANYLSYRYNTVGYHLTNILCHCLVGLLLFMFCRQTGASPGGSAAAVLVYALHPLMVGTVSYIVQNAAQWAAIFCLVSLVIYAHARACGRTWLCLVALALWGVACICKENAYIFPLVLVVYEWTIVQRCRISIRGLCIVYAIEAFVITMILTNLHYITKLSRYRHFTAWERFCTEGKIMFVYWSQVFCPRLNAYTINHDVPICGHPGWWIAIGVICSYLSWCGYRHNRLLLFAILSFFIMMIPETSVVSLELIFEHRMYLPLLFFVPVLAKVNLHHNTLSALLIGYLVFINVQYQNVWRTEFKTWQHAAKVSHRCPRANLAYARMLVRSGRTLEAIGYYDKTMRCYPKHSGYWQYQARQDLQKYIPLFCEDINALAHKGTR